MDSPAVRVGFGRVVVSALVSLLLAGGLVVVAGAPAAAEEACPQATGVAAPDQATALARAAACGAPVEDESARGHRQRSWAQPTGSVVTELAAVAQWTRDQAGEWVDIDTTLVAEPDGSVRAAAVVGGVTLSDGGSGPLATLTDPAGRSLSLTWPRELPAPRLAGSEATYPQVLPDVDLVVSVDVDGFSYLLVVHTPAAAAGLVGVPFEVGIAGDGVEIVQDADGIVHGVDEAGEPVFSSSQALMWDSPAPPAQPVGPPGDEWLPEEASPGRVEGLELELAGETLRVVPDPELLLDPGLRYPLYLDPKFHSVGQRNWATVFRERPNQGWTNDNAWPRTPERTAMRVGLCNDPSGACQDATGLWRGVMRFDTTPLADRHILSAAVKVTQTHTHGCGSYGLRLWQVNGFSNGVSWNEVVWKSRTSNGYLQSRTVPSSNCGGGNQPVTFNNSYVRQRVQVHADHPYGSISFGLRTADEGAYVQSRRFSRNSLRLEVEHTSYPQTPTNLSTHGNGCATSSPGPWLTTGRPTLSGKPRNADGTGRYHLRVYRVGSSTAYTYRSGVITVNRTVSRTIPSGSTLADGTYRWTMRTESPYSGVTPSAYASWCYFRVDTTPPPEPSATQLTEDPQQGDSVQFRLVGSSETDRFRYNLTGGANTTVTASDGVATVTVTPPTTSIDHQLQVWALDAAGNLSARHDLWFTVSKDLRVQVAGFWRFDGDWRDDTGHGHDLTAGPGVSLTPDRQGRSEAAVRFSAVPDGCLKTDGPVLDTTTSFTVAAWVVLLSDGGDRHPSFITQAGNVRPAFYLQWQRTDNRWKFVMPHADQQDVTLAAASALEPVTMGQWQHVAGVYDAAAGKVRLYVDGVLQEASASHPSGWQAAGPFVIGCAATIDGENWYEGDLAIDDVVAYQGVLTDAQIRELRERGAPAGKVSWWPLRGSGDDAGPAGNPLAPPPSVTWGPDAFGRAGGAMRLDGSSCAVAAGPGVRTDASFTVAAWVHPSDAGDTPRTVISQPGAINTAFQLTRSANNQWGFVLADADATDASYPSVHAPPGATTGGWQHLVGVYYAEAATIQIFVDGVLRSEAAAPAQLWRAGGGLHVGCAASATATWRHFEGSVHDVKVWRGAATPEQANAVALERRALWELREEVGGTDDWGDNDLTFHGAHEWVEDRYADCFAAYGLGLDGDGYAQTAGPVVRTDESFTVSAWAKLDDKSSNRTVVSQAASARPSFYLNYHGGRDRWQFELPAVDQQSTTWHTAKSNEAPQVGVWYHLTGVYDLGANEVRLYVDGVFQDAVPGPAAPWHTDGELLIGSAGSTAGERWSPMMGAVDQVRVYQGVLDRFRIADQQDRPLFPIPPPDCDF